MAQKEQGIARSVLLVVALGTFLAQLDGTVMNVALPTLARAFRTASLSTVQPVITAYLVTGVSLLPLLGKLADRYGRKRLFLFGFALFGAASLCAAFVTSLSALIALRVVQAVGGALLSGTALALIARNSGTRRGESLGKLSVVYAISGLIGPPLGGTLVQAFGWPAVFILNVPLSAVGIFLGYRVLQPDTQVQPQGGIDILGTVLFGGGTAAVTIAVAGARSGAVSVAHLAIAWQAALALGIGCYGVLMWWESRAPGRKIDPLFAISILRTRAYSLGLLMAFLSNGLSIGLFVLIPFWLARGWHTGPGSQGLIFLPVALGLGGLAPFAGRLSDRVGARVLTTAGMVSGGLAALLLSWQATRLEWPFVVLAMFLLGAATGLFSAPNSNAVLAAVRSEDLGVAGSMLSAARTLGVILGVAGMASAFDLLRSVHGNNPAAQLLFLGAAVLYLLNAVFCWLGRETAPQDPTENSTTLQFSRTRGSSTLRS